MRSITSKPVVVEKIVRWEIKRTRQVGGQLIHYCPNPEPKERVWDTLVFKIPTVFR